MYRNNKIILDFNKLKIDCLGALEINEPIFFKIVMDYQYFCFNMKNIFCSVKTLSCYLLLFNLGHLACIRD